MEIISISYILKNSLDVCVLHSLNIELLYKEFESANLKSGIYKVFELVDYASGERKEIYTGKYFGKL